MSKSIAEMTAEIVAAQLSQRDMSSKEIVSALISIHTVLKELKDIEAGKSIPSLEPMAKPEPKPEPVEPEPVGISAAVKETQAPSAAPPMKPEDSIKEEKIICLECGREFKQISHTHLKQSHGLTTKEYREKHGIPASQPLTAKSLSEKRRKRAKEAQLGETLKRAREAKK